MGGGLILFSKNRNSRVGGVLCKVPSMHGGGVDIFWNNTIATALLAVSPVVMYGALHVIEVLYTYIQYRSNVS